ncbi:Spy/CpxP family protein refolding chaperone [Thermospira aquatica]|uniref:Spy/CpxP family protein refolding chaperone n=1 Tax=Thermospira aquatica TaxID=2828656 RepID=A0AAX3BEZ4_9SPIR|nr:Spy/CpxP family protein refolding chaperone [Thermospira aquatica]URA10698.1 Spy/CpxP family protein refolding chaperone [Thermospira aquatica]
MRRTVWIMVLSGIAGVSMLFGWGPAGVQGARSSVNYGPRMGMRGIGMITNLSQDQKDKIFAIQQNLEKDIASLQTEANQIRYDLHKVLTATNVDEKKAKDLHAKLQSIQQKIADRRFQAELDMLKVLTPEQRQQLQNLPAPNRGRGGRMGKW